MANGHSIPLASLESIRADESLGRTHPEVRGQVHDYQHRRVPVHGRAAEALDPS